MKCYALGKTERPVLRLFPGTCCPWQANPGAFSGLPLLVAPLVSLVQAGLGVLLES